MQIVDKAGAVEFNLFVRQFIHFVDMSCLHCKIQAFHDLQFLDNDIRSIIVLM